MGVVSRSTLILAISAFFSFAWAESFVVERIDVVGLQRVSLGSVLTELSLREGDRVDESEASEWIHDVFGTGFFYDVSVTREGNVVVIEVVERPAIEAINFDGNRSIPTDTLKTVFSDVGLEKGEIFSRSLLENIQLELERQYGLQGRYNARVKTEVTPLTRNRVDIELIIEEGPVAKIAHIELVGNEQFDDETLFRAMRMQTSDRGALLHWANKRNQYSNAALTGDLQRLEDFYFDLGYLDYTVESYQVSISEDKSDITVAYNMQEGMPYQVAEVKLIGDLIHLEDEIRSEINIENGSIYNRSSVSSIVRSVTDLLGENGYAFAKVRDFTEKGDDQTVTV